MMYLLADEPIIEAGDLADDSALFPTPTLFEDETSGQKPRSRVSREQMDAFLSAESDAQKAHFSASAGELPPAATDMHMAAGVLKQAARDLRRFRTATKGVKRELYLDAHQWITAYDFSWPYSFVNVCAALDVCPEILRAQLLADASLSWFDYWMQRVGRVLQKVRSSFDGIYAGFANPQGAEARQLASCI